MAAFEYFKRTSREKQLRINWAIALIKNDLIAFHGYEIDRACCSLRWQQAPIGLNRKTFELLLYLVEYRERVVTRDELLKALWPDQFVEEGNLTQHVFLLRKALSRHHSDSGSGSRLIETLAGRGYRFTAPVLESAPAPKGVAIGLSQSITRMTVKEEETGEAARPESDIALWMDLAKSRFVSVVSSSHVRSTLRVHADASALSLKPAMQALAALQSKAHV